MGLLGLLKRKGAEQAPEAVAAEPCIHGVRIPHWDSAADMGHEDRASYFVCESCGERFTPEQNAALHPSDVVASPGA
jgi:hypothetical protein